MQPANGGYSRVARMEGQMVGGRRLVRAWQVMAVLVCAVLALAGCSGPTARPKPAAPTVGPTATANTPAQPPELLCGGPSGRACQLSLFATEPDDGVAPLTSRFAQATRSIDFVPFLLDEPA